MVSNLTDNENINLAETALSKYKLCDHCLGRLFAKIDHGITNKERGERIRKHLKQSEKTEVINCWLCSGLIDEIHHFADLSFDSLQDYEFDTFLIGSKIDEDILDKEQELLKYSQSETAEPLKMEINREVGKILEKKLGKTVDLEKPDIMAIIDTAFDVVRLQIKSLLIYGRYKKFVRGIPQTRWPCKICRGKGCKACNDTGKMYETSVEELISKKTLEVTQGSDASFHGSGREDIDALMLGNGRPFVLEIKNPKIRVIDLAKLEKEINNYAKDKIEISAFRWSDKDEVARIKSADFRKTYHLVVEGEEPIDKEKLKEAARVLQGKTIRQLTPTRVAHRRADKVREKKVYNCNIESVEDTIARLTVETESGAYIKELISGDHGRTQPNISELIGIPCKVKELDVIAVKWE